MGLFNMLKKIKCKHNYMYYGRTGICDSLSWNFYYKFNFVCSKCEKEIAINEADIKKQMQTYSEYVKKEKALGREPDVDVTEFTLYRYRKTDIFYEGKYVDLVIKHFKDKYNIDIREIKHRR